jgi:hypothetical protein
MPRTPGIKAVTGRNTQRRKPHGIVPCTRCRALGLKPRCSPSCQWRQHPLHVLLVKKPSTLGSRLLGATRGVPVEQDHRSVAGVITK